MNTLQTTDVRKTQEIARKLNLKLTGWQFAQLAGELGAIRQSTVDTMQLHITRAHTVGMMDALNHVKSDVEGLNAMFDTYLKGMFLDLKQEAAGGGDDE